MVVKFARLKIEYVPTLITSSSLYCYVQNVYKIICMSTSPHYTHTSPSYIISLVRKHY